ncbi:MAG: hypothetical protein K8S94_01010 [Planctomycetia bacterium]|nr:hypothetical protein [Planctomycetia bacterium]
MPPFALRSRCGVSVALRTALLGILLGIAADSAVGKAATAEPVSGVLDLPGGGTLPGSLVPAAATDAGIRDTLVWKSPVFAQPFEFDLRAIVGVRLPGPWAKVDAPFRLQLRGGDMLDGAIEAIDADRVVVRPAGAADSPPVPVSRSIIDGISRLGGKIAGSYVGPGSLSGWDHAPANAWRAEAGGILATRAATASRDVGAPGRACYDVVLSWRRSPEFRLSVAAASKAANDPYWIECLQLPDGTRAAAVFRQEPTRAAVEPLEFADDGAKTVRIVIFVDQAKGRLAAFTSIEGKTGPVADVTVPPQAAGEVSSLFRISVGGGDVCLESLRVRPWTSPEPVIEERSSTAVVTRDGRVESVEIESFDQSAGELVLRSSVGPSRISIEDVEEIRLASPVRGVEAAPAQPTDSATVRVVRASGGTLAGQLVAVEEHALRLQAEGIDGSVVVPLTDLVSLTSLAASPAVPEPEASAALPGRVGSLVADGVSLRGCVVDGSPWSAGLAWQPQGSATASPLAATAESADVAIEYVPRLIRDPVGAAEVEVGGIGGMVNQDGQGFFVVTMLSEDGAAAQDGRLMPGDRLLAIKPRAEAGFVPTKGLDVVTVMNLLRGRVGSPIVLKVAAAGDEPREIDLARGLIYVAGTDVLEQALTTHARLAKAVVDKPAEAAAYPSTVILRSGDVVPCEVVGIDGKAMRLRTPFFDGGTGEPVVVPSNLIQAVELDPAAASRTLEKVRLDRLLTLPRSQREAPPTHMIRLDDGDYLRGRLERLDDETLTVDVRGEVKKLPRSAVARVIWLHPEQDGDDEGDEQSDAAKPAGLLVQGVVERLARRRVTLIADRVEESTIHGTSPALGAGKIDLTMVDRLLIGRAIEKESAELPYRQWRMKPAPEPRSLRDAAEPRKAGAE